MSKEASDGLIDIQIEESLVRETLMTIDSSSFVDDVFAVLWLVFTILVIALVGYFGPSFNSLLRSNIYPVSSGGILKIPYSINTITQAHRFAAVALNFERNSTSHNAIMPVHYRYEISFFDSRGASVHPVTSLLTKRNVTFLSGSHSSNPLYIWSQPIIDFVNLSFLVQIEKVPDGVETAYLSTVLGDPAHTMFQVYLRIGTSLVALVGLVMFLYALHRIPLKLWHLEQKMTVPLLALVALFNNPFFALNVFWPSKAFPVYSSIVTHVFELYLQFYLLVLFDSLRYKSRKTGPCFFLPKVVFFLVLFVFHIAQSISSTLSPVELLSIETDTTQMVLDRIVMALSIVYLLWAFVAIIMALRYVDVTERYKWNIYLGAAAIAPLAYGATYTLFDVSRATRFIMSFVMANSVVVIMTYFHWPYEMLPEPSIEQANELAEEQTGEPCEIVNTEN